MILTGFLAVFLIYLRSAEPLILPEVTIKDGTLRGVYGKTINDLQFFKFLGIPYAKAPIGNYRFKESVPSDPWLGIYNATRNPTPCLQYNHMFYKTKFAVLGSEDCLYVNVYTPMLPSSNNDNLMNVIALIHGGAFMMMSSTMYTPETLLDYDVVFVSFNYRLGPLGFFSTEDNVVPGNNGLKDQLLALKWIQQNIAAFGGDPKKVTLIGFSAGGASVHYHMISPLSKGLFKRAASSGGTTLCPWALTENPREKASIISNAMGCPTHDSLEMVRCLRTRPAEHIVELSKLLQPFLYNPFSPYGPVIEPNNPKAFLPESPINLIKQGKAEDVPWLLSFAPGEGLYPGADILKEPKDINNLKQNWEHFLPFIMDFNYTVYDKNEKTRITKTITNHYKVNLDTPEGRNNFIKMIGDRMYLYGISKAVKLHSALYSSPVYLYKFSYRGQNSGSSFFTTEILDSFHCDDSFYVLNTDMFNVQENENDRKVSAQMIKIWIDFAKNGILNEPWMPVKDTLPNLSYVHVQNYNIFEPTIIN